MRLSVSCGKQPATPTTGCSDRWAPIFGWRNPAADDERNTDRHTEAERSGKEIQGHTDIDVYTVRGLCR
jgi:hypothetical protein